MGVETLDTYPRPCCFQVPNSSLYARVKRSILSCTKSKDTTDIILDAEAISLMIPTASEPFPSDKEGGR